MDAQTVLIRAVLNFVSMLLHVAQVFIEAIGSHVPTIPTEAEFLGIPSFNVSLSAQGCGMEVIIQQFSLQSSRAKHFCCLKNGMTFYIPE